MVCRLLKSEMLPIRTARPTSSTRQTTAKIANLNAEAGKWRQNLTTNPRAAGGGARRAWSGLDVSGWPMMP